MATATLTKLQNVIDGELVDAADGATEAVLNPATAEAIAEAPVSSAEDVDRAVAAARRAFETWSRTTPRERSERLLALAQLFDDHFEEFLSIESAEAGKPIEMAREEEMPNNADHLRFFAGAARVMEGKASAEFVENRTSIIRREPVGVVGQITPWNYPLSMAVWKIGPALATGNTVVLKPAENTPMGTLRLAELAADILPPGVLNVIGGHGEPARRTARPPRGRRHGLPHRLARDRQVDRARGLGHAEARAPGARRQGPRDRLRRRGHGGRGRDDHGDRPLQRRPGLHRGMPGAGGRVRVRRCGQRPRRPGEGLRRG